MSVVKKIVIGMITICACVPFEVVAEVIDADGHPNTPAGHSLNPSFATADYTLGSAFFRDGQYEAAVASLEKALRLGANNPDNYQVATLLGYTQYSMRNHEAALSWADVALRMAPTFTQAQGLRAATLALLDRIDEAKASIDHFLAMVPNATATRIARNYRLRKQEDVAHYRDGLIKAGLPV